SGQDHAEAAGGEIHSRPRGGKTDFRGIHRARGGSCRHRRNAPPRARWIPRKSESIVPAADRVGTGETPIGITFARFVLTYNKQGASLDYVRDYNMLGDGQYISLGSKAPRPNAGKAFIDFFLDEESMT